MSTEFQSLAFQKLLEVLEKDGDAHLIETLDPETRKLYDEIVEIERTLQSTSQSESKKPLFDVASFLQRITDSGLGVVESLATESGSESEPSKSLSDHLEDYALKEKIGQGGSGTVYRAKHLVLKTTVAVKVLHERASLESEARFRREMRVIANLKSPHIVKALDARIVRGRPVLVMEHIDGQTLSEHVSQREGLDFRSICKLLEEVSLGLATAHAAGVVHRDIKPSNIMVDRSGNAKILDLGLASIRHAPAESDLHSSQGSSLTNTSNMMGTIDFVAPEQVTDSKHVDYRADLYSLGAVAYWLLAKEVPFPESKYKSRVARLLAKGSVVPSELSAIDSSISAELSVLVSSLLRINPHERPASAEWVAHSFNHLAMI